MGTLCVFFVDAAFFSEFFAFLDVTSAFLGLRIGAWSTSPGNGIRIVWYEIRSVLIILLSR